MPHAPHSAERSEPCERRNVRKVQIGVRFRLVATPSTAEPDFERLVSRVAAAGPRSIVLCAPAGYRKREFLRAYAGSRATLLNCELSPDRDASATILDALVHPDARRADYSAADRLARGAESSDASSRESLRREWPLERETEVFDLCDREGSLATRSGLDLCQELVASCPAHRTLALRIRTPLPPALAHAIAGPRTVVLDSSDLALTEREVAELATKAAVPIEYAETAARLTGGWPLAMRLFVPLLDRERDEMLKAVRAVPAEAVLTFALHRTIAAVSDDLRAALAVTVLLRQANHDDLIRVLGNRCDDAVFATLAALPFVHCNGGYASVHHVAAQVLRARFRPVVVAAFDRTLSVLSGDGSYVEAARVALDAGEPVRAAAIIDAAPPYTAAPVPIAEYERIIERIDRDLITRFPNLWIATIPYRSFSVDTATYLREAETVYYCLTASAPADQRAAVLMLLASAYINLGRGREAYELLEDALTGFASRPARPRAALLNFSAALRGIEGRFSLARSLAEEAASIAHDAFGESQALLYLEAHEAAYRGKQSRVVVIMDELVRRRGRDGLPLYIAYAAASGAIFSWVNGDEESFLRYIGAMEDAITPGLEAGLSPIVDSARGRTLRTAHEGQWPALAAMAQLYEIANADTDAHALEAARSAAANADVRGDPWVQILAHAAIFTLDHAARASEAQILREVVKPIESLELHAAVDSLVRNDNAGILENYVSRRVRRDRERRAPRITVELVAGRVHKDGATVRLTDKEFELVALLAANHGSLSRDRVGEALWDHLDPDEWRNNYKVTVHRIRNKLGMHEAIATEDGRCRLTPAIEVDLRNLESLIRDPRPLSLTPEIRATFEAAVSAFQSGLFQRFERFGWAQALIVRMTDVVCRCGIALAVDAKERGLAAEALSRLSDVRDVDPLNEEACEIMIRMLLEQGNRDAARHELQRYAAVLAKELGASPSPTLVHLVRDA